MKMWFPKYTIRSVMLFTLLFVCVQFLLIFPSYAGKDWKVYVTDFSSELMKTQKRGGNIFVSAIHDESRRQVYYPFMETIRKIMLINLRENGFVVSPTPAGVDQYIMTSFLEQPGSLFLNASVQNAEDGTVLESRTVEIPIASLPSYWRKRSLRNIAYELASKLDEKLFGRRVNILLGEFSGGGNKNDAFVSELSLMLKGYIEEEMMKLGTFTLLTPAKQRSVDKTVSILHGRYRVTGNDILFRLILQQGETVKKEIANVSTKFTTSSLPPGMAIYPPNPTVAKQNEEPFRSKEKTPGTDIPIRVWTNKRSGIFHDNDALIIYLRATKDCYVRVYYVQSDGVVLQPFPSNTYETGRLKKGKTYAIGGNEDEVRLRISNATVGQEFIKVFASKIPIDDAAIPKTFIPGANVFIVRGGFRAVEMIRKKLIPVAEVKILVK